MDLYNDISVSARYLALSYADRQIAERATRSDVSGPDGSRGQAIEVRVQQKMAQHGVLLAAEADTRLANGIMAAAGTSAGTAVDIRV